MPIEFNRTYDRNQKKLHIAVNWIVDIIAVAALAIFTVYAFGTRVTVTGSAMNPVLNAGDVVLMDRLAYDLGKPKRFDIAVFERPGSGYNIKRIIGLPGETVQITDNTVLINGEPLESDEISSDVMLAGIAEYPVELGYDEYFLLGDNRESSEDSRFSTIGNIKKDQLAGKVWLRFSPLSELGLVH